MIDRSFSSINKNHCFLENVKSKKIFFFNIKNFFILEFETNLFRQKLFSDIFFAEKDFSENLVFYKIVNTHTSKVVCVWTKKRRFLKFLNCFQFKMKKRR